MKYQCGKRGDCPIGKRDNENFCRHKKYCSHKIEIKRIIPSEKSTKLAEKLLENK